MQFKGYRTLILNVLASVPVVLEVLKAPEFLQFVPPEHMAKYTLAVLVMNLWLRSRTTTAIGRAS